MVQNSWVMENLAQPKMLTNQQAWQGKFFVFKNDCYNNYFRKNLEMMFVTKNKEHAELIGRIPLFCWMASSICATLVELGKLGRFSASMKKLEKDLKNTNIYHNEEYRAKLKKSNERSLA